MHSAAMKSTFMERIMLCFTLSQANDTLCLLHHRGRGCYGFPASHGRSRVSPPRPQSVCRKLNDAATHWETTRLASLYIIRYAPQAYRVPSLCCQVYAIRM